MFSKKSFISETFSYGIPAIVLLSGNTILAASLLIGSELQQKFFVEKSVSNETKGMAKNFIKAIGAEKPKNAIDILFEIDKPFTQYFFYPHFKDYCEEESFCKGFTYLNLFTAALSFVSALTFYSTPFILPVLGLYSGVLLSRAGQELEKQIPIIPGF